MSTSKPRIPINDCGCCEGQTATAPLYINNRHGLDTVSYRIGDYHRFLETMLARLSSSELPSLQSLTTREPSDFSIALIDAWANVSEVLSFYQEYFANESMLHTAKERLSILEHARLIGYQLNPGVTASTYLAFIMDEPLAAVDHPLLDTLVPAGSQVQSTPGPDETAQIFETQIDIRARVRWNALRPRLEQPQIIGTSMASVVIHGITSFVEPGDDLLLIDQHDNKQINQIIDVVADEDRQTTQLIFSENTTSPSTFSVMPKDPAGTYAIFDGEPTINDEVINKFVTHSWAVEDIAAIADTKHWDLGEIAERINMHPQVIADISSDEGGVYGFHQRANLFGYNAMKRVTYNCDGTPKDISQWNDWNADESNHTIYLDNDYSEITPGSYCVLRNTGDTVFKLSAAQSLVRSEYGISSKSSKLTLASGDQWYASGTSDSSVMKNLIRKTVVLAQSEKLPLAPVKISESVKDEKLLLDRADLDLRGQQYIAVSGEPVDQPGVEVSEVVQVDQVRLEHGFTELTFTTSLHYEYKRSTVTVNANVAPASHGETVSEVLGSGDAGVASQVFSLKQIPLTHVSASLPSGALSTLEIRVNDILWHEVETFLGHGSKEQIYTTKLQDNGAVQILFGDGLEGARLPSGTNNVVARYRKGIGLDGLVDTHQANMLLTRPLGIKDAINPVKSSGADDPENLEDARANAPLGLLTLGRTVSLSDYEDFCRAFAGVAKARAIAVSNNGVPGVVITIAGPDAEVLDSSGSTYNNLLNALNDAGDPYTRFTVLPFRPAYFKVDAGLYIHDDYQADLALEAARQAMREYFSFERRMFNQPVHLSEVVGTLQQTDGVVAVDVNYLYRSDASPVSPPPRSILPNVASGAHAGVQGAELIMLDPSPLDQLRVKT